MLIDVEELSHLEGWCDREALRAVVLWSWKSSRGEVGVGLVGRS